MKNLITLLAISIIAFSCSKEEQEIELNKENNSQLERSNSETRYSSNSLVIKYKTGVNDSQKNSLRDFYHVTRYELCDHCSSQEIELWTFGNDIEIEPSKVTIDDPQGGIKSALINGGLYGLIVNVDYNYYLEGDASRNKESKLNKNMSLSYDYQTYIKQNNDGVTIAVFDTGIYPEAGGNSLFLNKFLYNASNDGIPGIYSGWDFVNHDNDCFDDDIELHGTAVTSIITNILDNEYPYQILPLKVSDEEGFASYFNFLCALNYALPRAEILNMSLGWYDVNYTDLVDSIFLDLVGQYPNSIIICSAGNKSSNNDIKYHFPSGYPLDNIISVASCDDSYSDISWFSNYGIETVDFFAIGENITFLGNQIKGTSFSAPKVTAMVAREKSTNQQASSNEIIQNLILLGIPSQGFAFQVKHQSILIP